MAVNLIIEPNPALLRANPKFVLGEDDIQAVGVSLIGYRVSIRWPLHGVVTARIDHLFESAQILEHAPKTATEEFRLVLTFARMETGVMLDVPLTK